MQWKDGGGHYGLKQETKYPFDNKIQIQVSASQPKDYTLYVRIPGWAQSNPALSVNGKRVSEAVDPGTFASIRRTWKDGDRVELELPMPLRLEAVDANHPNMVALMQGPLVLFATADSQPSFNRWLIPQTAVRNSRWRRRWRSCLWSDETNHSFGSISYADNNRYSNYNSVYFDFKGRFSALQEFPGNDTLDDARRGLFETRAEERGAGVIPQCAEDRSGQHSGVTRDGANRI